MGWSFKYLLVFLDALNVTTCWYFTIYDRGLTKKRGIWEYGGFFWDGIGIWWVFKLQDVQVHVLTNYKEGYTGDIHCGDIRIYWSYTIWIAVFRHWTDGNYTWVIIPIARWLFFITAIFRLVNYSKISKGTIWLWLTVRHGKIHPCY